MKLALVLCVLSPLAAAQVMQYELDAPTGVRRYGEQVAALGDLDGDGLPDFALSAYGQRVELHSGADGLLLAVRENAVFGYGAVLASAGDADGDGHPDLLVGTPGPFMGDELNPQPTPGFVELLSGADASLLRRFDEQGGGDDEFGRALLSLGDVNADGHADFAIGAPANVYSALVPGVNSPGHVYAFSGADGALLWTTPGAEPRAGFGASLAALPDLDGDGLGELAVGAPAAAFNFQSVEPPPEIDLLSGASGARLRRIPQPDWASPTVPDIGFGAMLATVPNPTGLPRLLVGIHPSYWFTLENGAALIDLQGHLLGATHGFGSLGNQLGASLAAGDITGDGSPELFLGHNWGSALALLDADMSWRNELSGYGQFPVVDPQMVGSIGASCAVLGDVTGDGLADFLMGDSTAGGDALTYGRVRVFRGGPGPWTVVGGASVGSLAALNLYPCLTRTPLTAYSPDSEVAVFARALRVPFNSLGRLVIGLQTLMQPMAGGVLVPEPQYSASVVNLPEDMVLLGQLPESLPSGLTFWMQLAVVVPGGGVTLSDAWRGELP